MPFEVCVLDGEDEVVLSRRVEVTEEALEAVCSEILALDVSDERVVGIDLTGGPGHCWRRYCSGEKVRYMPETAVSKAREAYAGGEQKSDPGDAFVNADQLRLRWKSLSEVRVRDENVAELRALVAYRCMELWNSRKLIREAIQSTVPRGLFSKIGYHS